MSRPPLLVLVLALLLALPFAGPAGAAGACPQMRSPSLDRAAALIRTRAELEAWVAGPRGSDDPLEALPAPARSRFLASLRFGPQGVRSFQSEALQGELSASQAWRLLALFGLQAALAAMPALAVRSPEDAEVEAWRRAQMPGDDE